MSQRRRFSLCTSCDHSSSQHFRRAAARHVARTNWTSTNDYSNNVFFSRGEGNGQLLVQHPLSSPLVRNLNNSQKFSVIHYRHGYYVHRICAFVTRDMDAKHQGAGGDHVVKTQSGGADVRLPFQWRLTQERSEVGSAARTRSTQHTSTVISLFSSGAYCFSLAE